MLDSSLGGITGQVGNSPQPMEATTLCLPCPGAATVQGCLTDDLQQINHSRANGKQNKTEVTLSLSQDKMSFSHISLGFVCNFPFSSLLNQMEICKNYPLVPKHRRQRNAVCDSPREGWSPEEAGSFIVALVSGWREATDKRTLPECLQLPSFKRSYQGLAPYLCKEQRTPAARQGGWKRFP